MDIDLEKLKETVSKYNARPWYSDIIMNISFLWALIKSDGLIRACKVFYLTLRDQRRYAKTAKVRLSNFAIEHGYIRVKGKWVK